MKPLINLSTTTVWVVGRSSATAQLINQIGPFSPLLAFRKITRANHLVQAIKAEPTSCQQIIIVTTEKLTYSDLDTLKALSVSMPNVRIAICFSLAHLGIISYAWALDFAAYFTIDDASSDCHQLVDQLLDDPKTEIFHSAVFCEWLRQYGILFEHDQSPYSSCDVRL